MIYIETSTQYFARIMEVAKKMYINGDNMFDSKWLKKYFELWQLTWLMWWFWLWSHETHRPYPLMN